MSVEGIVHPKRKIFCKSSHPQAIQDVDEFISSWEQNCRNAVFHHLLTSGSSAVDGRLKNESPVHIYLPIQTRLNIMQYYGLIIPILAGFVSYKCAAFIVMC